MTTSPARVRDAALPPHLAVVGGVCTSLAIGSLALLVAGQGIAAWVLLIASLATQAVAQLAWRRRVDGRPFGLASGLGSLATSLAVLVAAGLAAQAVVATAPWLVVVIAVLAGAANGWLLRWWQLRPVLSPV